MKDKELSNIYIDYFNKLIKLPPIKDCNLCRPITAAFLTMVLNVIISKRTVFEQQYMNKIKQIVGNSLLTPSDLNFMTYLGTCDIIEAVLLEQISPHNVWYSKEDLLKLSSLSRIFICYGDLLTSAPPIISPKQYQVATFKSNFLESNFSDNMIICYSIILEFLSAINNTIKDDPCPLNTDN